MFQSPKMYAAPSGSNALQAGDFNGDGKQDLITTEVQVQGPLCFPSSTAMETAHSTPPATHIRNRFLQPYTVGDFNGDGVTDIALLLVPPTETSLFTSVQILLGSTSGTFSSGVSLAVMAPASSGFRLQ